MILAVPCCQHELNGQLRADGLAPLLEHGILRERFAALATDAARAQLLEAVGYRTQVVEFVDLEHTAKNVLIRAVRKGGGDAEALRRYRAFKEQLGIDPALERALQDHCLRRRMTDDSREVQHEPEVLEGDDEPPRMPASPMAFHAGAPRAARRAPGVPGSAARVDPGGDRRDRHRDLGGHAVTPIAIALFEGAEELDWAGPWEVLAAWSQRWPDDGVEVFTLARKVGDPVTCAKGLRVLPDHGWETAPRSTCSSIPVARARGGSCRTRPSSVAPRPARRGTLMTSVCTGSLVYAAAGSCEGRPATTYWSHWTTSASSTRRSTSGPRTGSSTAARS